MVTTTGAATATERTASDLKLKKNDAVYSGEEVVGGCKVSCVWRLQTLAGRNRSRLSVSRLTDGQHGSQLALQFAVDSNEFQSLKTSRLK